MSDQEKDAVSMTDEEFQFFKNKLQQTVKEYLSLDEQIAALRKGLKERNAKKNETSNEIIDIMKKLGIDNLNVKDGKLVSKTSTRNKVISKATLVDGLGELFKDDDVKLQNAMKTILEKRQKVEVTSLKHVKNKQKNLNILD
tara:strand:- start:733 stop:1158 length:426 start_codon:yes stop_codon:yes gene_type:complete